VAFSKFDNVNIAGISLVVPKHVICIDDEIEFYKNDRKILERNKKILGLGYRHIADEGTSLSDLCLDASLKLFEGLNINPCEIDALIVASTSLDYKYPATSCVLHGKLGLKEDCISFDITGLACSAYVYGLSVAHSLVSSGAAKKCLLLVGEIASIHSDKRNRNSNMLFGDGAAATLIEASQCHKESFFYTGTRGKDWDKIIAPAGGWSLPVQEDIISIEETDSRGNVWHLWDEIMKGMDVFKFATDIGPEGIGKILEYSKNQIEDIDYFAFHQANKQIVNSVASYSKIPESKFSTEAFYLYGNCGSASIVTDICHSICGKSPAKVLLSSFGVGLSWGFAVLDFSDCKIMSIYSFDPREKILSRSEKIDYWIDYFKK